MSVLIQQEKEQLLQKAAQQKTLAPAIIDYLGTAVDVFAPTPAEGLGLSIFDFSKAETKTVEIAGIELDIPSIVNLLPNTKISQQAGAKTSVISVANEISASVGVEGRAGMFSAGIKASYSQSNTDSSEAYYAYMYESVSFAEMLLNTQDSKYFSDDFAKDLNALPSTLDKKGMQAYSQFFHKWGLYYLSHCGLGGELDTLNAVSKNNSTSTTTAQVDLSAQYQGLFYSGKFEASVTGSQSWQSFSSFSQTQFYITGGSPGAQGKILSLDPMKPSQTSVDAHVEWLNSLAMTPSPTQMYMRPISELAGAKQSVMNEAASRYVTSVEFSTNLTYNGYTSQGGGSGEEWSGQAAVYVNGSYVPPANVKNPGFQVTILDRLNASNIVANEFFGYDQSNWQNSYEQMYHEMLSFLQRYGNDNIVILASDEVYGGAYPTTEMQNYLNKILGVGATLEKWANNQGGRKSAHGEVTVLFYVVGVPNNGLNSGYGFYQGLFEYYGNSKTYSNINGASLLLNSDLKTTIVEGDS